MQVKVGKFELIADASDRPGMWYDWVRWVKSDGEFIGVLRRVGSEWRFKQDGYGGDGLHPDQLRGVAQLMEAIKRSESQVAN